MRWLGNPLVTFIKAGILHSIVCLAIPAEVLDIEGNVATVDFGGIKREVDVSLTDAKVGQYVIVHAGFAIQVLDEEEAKETLTLFDQILGEDIA
ncbi:MAG: HypC/HybG/HupF family hydrogenase formation chaperone [Thermoplasmata archaeon]